jgi:transposase
MAKKGDPRKKKSKAETGVPVIRPNVAGVDIGSTEHWVCGPASADGPGKVRVFRTTTPELKALANWLKRQGVESVAMESTYVYWIPLYELLESHGFEVVLVNARQLHNVPGRKTDMNDCQWIQTLHSCGLLRGSFRPGESICALRAVQRQLGNLVAQRSRSIQWMQKALDQMNVQVHRAVTDISGKTGMAIVRAIVDGERDPQRLAALRDKRCRKSEAKIAEHLTGNWRDEHLFNLASALRLFDMLEAEITTYEGRLTQELERLQPEDRRDAPAPAHPNPAKEKAIARRGDSDVRTALWRFAGCDLTRIDGISAGSAKIVLHEVGLDLSAFPTEKHFVSWLRLCPRVPISGGKPIRKRKNSLGANRIAGVLRMAALSLQRSKSALGAFFRRTARHKGGAVAVFATARKLAVLIYRMLRYGHDYTDLGEEAYEARFQQRRIAALRENAKSLGFMVVPASTAG